MYFRVCFKSTRIYRVYRASLMQDECTKSVSRCALSARMQHTSIHVTQYKVDKQRKLRKTGIYIKLAPQFHFHTSHIVLLLQVD